MTATKRCELILEPISKRIDVAEGSTIYDAIVALNFPIGAFCGGKGTCGKCKIRIVDPNASVSEPTDHEYRALTEEEIDEGYRLACQTKIFGDSRVYLTDQMMPKGNRILVDADLENLGIKNNVKIDPFIKTQKLYVIPADMNNPRNDFSGLAESMLVKDHLTIFENDIESIDDVKYEIARILPHAIRSHEGKISAYFRRTRDGRFQLFDVEENEQEKKAFGLAFDIGTTTVVGYLVNIETGLISSISAMLNPQVAIGEDLVSRITYIKENNALEKAQDLVTDAINHIINDVCRKAEMPKTAIKDMVVVGNTGMHHMFFGLPTDYLAVAPFVPVFKAPINISARKLGLNCNPNVNVYSPPVIAGYVGTDTIGCIVSSKIDKIDEYSLLIDIGTNGELVLGNKDGLISGSCAAGSALEGAHIKYGMRAAEGSIEALTIDPDTLEPNLTVIGEKHPVGICGSGLIDVTAEMLKSGILKRSGKFVKNRDFIKNNRRIVLRDDDIAYLLYKEEWDCGKFESNNAENSRSTTSIKEITISQEDIRQIQLAKGAFLAGAKLLLQAREKKPADLEQVILAGAFGSYINKENAGFIGLFPEVNTNKIFQIGNAAGLGAQFCLKNYGERQYANEVAHRVEYYEIASKKNFQKQYAYSLYFPFYKLDEFPNLAEKYEEFGIK